MIRRVTLKEEDMMKSVPNHLHNDHYMIRTQSTFFVDSIDIIPYADYLLISWKITSSTKKTLSEILNEEFEDLLIRMILYRNSLSKEMIEFPVSECSGTLQITSLSKGTYYCELVASNSHNETITIKTTTNLFFDKPINQNKNDKWNQVNDEAGNENWLKNFSGYTVYE